MRKSIIIPSIVFLISSSLYLYAIFQSRSSTAGIGVLFVPFISLIPTVFALIGAKSDKIKYQLMCSLFVFVYFSYEIHLINSTIQKNQNEDRKNKESYQRFQNYQKTLIDFKINDPLKFQDHLIELEKNKPERELILAILQTLECPTELLTKYSRSNDLGFTLIVAQNNHTPSSDLEHIFYNGNYSAYYYSSLARNTNTPPNVLKELYNLRDKNTLIVPNLLNNPNTPKEILENINN